VPSFFNPDEHRTVLQKARAGAAAATTFAELTAASDSITLVTTLAVGWRQHITEVRRGRPGDETDGARIDGDRPVRPAPYHSLMSRFYGALWALTRLPNKARPEQTLTRQAARVELAQRITDLERAVVEWESEVSDLDGAEAQAATEQITAYWEVGALPAEEPLASIALRLEEAESRLNWLIARIDIRDRPPMWVEPEHGPDWRPRERFAPPEHLLDTDDGNRPSLGTERVVRYSEDLVAALTQEVRNTLPPGLATVHAAEVDAALAEHLTVDKLLAHDDELLGDVYTFDIRGYQVEVSLDLSDEGWEQVSDGLEIRLKDMDNWRQRRSRRRGGGHFVDNNVNMTYIKESPTGKFPLELGSTEAFAGLATLVMNEHVESRNSTSGARRRPAPGDGMGTLGGGLGAWDRPSGVDEHESAAGRRRAGHPRLAGELDAAGRGRPEGLARHPRHA
jgi:hypothetical protein